MMNQQCNSTTKNHGIRYGILENTESYAAVSYHPAQEWLNPPTILTFEETLKNVEMMQVIAEEESGREKKKNHL
ncbi:hypothetical protein PV325_002420 [Microctonus aethiopoides]|nr:hypothetical protein PV325_002420 [Microctonus aethiopoides]